MHKNREVLVQALREEGQREREHSLRKMLAEARCPDKECDNKGVRMVSVVTWYEQKPCEWCERRRKLLDGPTLGE